MPGEQRNAALDREGEPALRERGKRELALPLVCLEVALAKERCFPLTGPSLPAAGGIKGPGIMRACKLALPLPCCSIHERGPCISPRQHTRSGPGGGGSGELAQEVRVWES